MPLKIGVEHKAVVSILGDINTLKEVIDEIISPNSSKKIRYKTPFETCILLITI